MFNLRFVFTSELWPWMPKPDADGNPSTSKGSSWVFARLPKDDSEEIRETIERKAGFGSVRVAVQIGDSRWKTSVFPDSESGCYVLPIKKAIRTAEKIEIGDVVEIDVEVVG